MFDINGTPVELLEVSAECVFAEFKRLLLNFVPQVLVVILGLTLLEQVIVDVMIPCLQLIHLVSLWDFVYLFHTQCMVSPRNDLLSVYDVFYYFGVYECITRDRTHGRCHRVFELNNLVIPWFAVFRHQLGGWDEIIKDRLTLQHVHFGFECFASVDC